VPCPFLFRSTCKPAVGVYSRIRSGQSILEISGIRRVVYIEPYQEPVARARSPKLPGFGHWRLPSFHRGAFFIGRELCQRLLTFGEEEPGHSFTVSFSGGHKPPLKQCNASRLRSMFHFALDSSNAVSCCLYLQRACVFSGQFTSGSTLNRESTGLETVFLTPDPS
jgi:hypothetical protein